MQSDSSTSVSSSTRKGANNDWSSNVTDVLDRIRENSVRLSEYHRHRFFHFKGYSKYFDLPVLVLSVLGSSFAVGTQSYLNQSTISGISCLIGVIVSIITSIKLYLSIETSMQNELKMSKNFYTLSIDVYRMLRLTPKERGENGLTYLHKVFSTYSKLMEESNLSNKAFHGDKLTSELDLQTPKPTPHKPKHHRLRQLVCRVLERGSPTSDPESKQDMSDVDDIELPHLVPLTDQDISPECPSSRTGEDLASFDETNAVL